MEKEEIIKILEDLKTEYLEHYPLDKKVCNYQEKISHVNGKIHAVEDIINIVKNK